MGLNKGDRKERRLKQNRESASRLRVRRKENKKNLEQETDELRQENLKLLQEVKMEKLYFRSKKKEVNFTIVW